MRLVEFYGMNETDASNPESLGWTRDPRSGNWQRGDLVIMRMSGHSADVDAGTGGWDYCLYAPNRHNQLDIVASDENLSVILAKADEIEGQDAETTFADRYK